MISEKKPAAAGSSSNATNNGGQVAGKEPSMGRLVFKYNSKDRVDMYLRTKKELANVAGKKYGSEMFNLVKYSDETTFTEPEEPKGNAQGMVNQATLEKYKIDYTTYTRESKAYDVNKSKVFVMILGQCTSDVINKLESDVDYKTLETNKDVVGLLEKLKDMTFGTGGKIHPYMARAKTLKRVANFSQGPTEGNTHCVNRLRGQSEVLAETSGFLYPDKLVPTGSSRNVQEQAQEQLLVMLLLDGADKVRYGALVRDLHNSYIGGIDKYPKTIDETMTMLTHWSDDTVKKKVHNKGDKNETETSFGQFKGKAKGAQKSQDERKFKCGNCGKFGHYTDQCNKPAGNQSNHNQNIVTDNKEEEELHWSGA